MTMGTTWREKYSPMITQMILENKVLPDKELKKLLRQANTGQYGHMKKIWANEYMRQIRQYRETGIILPFAQKGGRKSITPPINQTNLFTGREAGIK